MLFVGIALLIAVGLAFAISSDAGSLVGLSQAQTGQLVPLVIVLIFIAGGMFGRRHRFGELFRGLALWIGIFAVAAVGYTYRDDLLGVVGRVSGEFRPGAAVIDAERGTSTFRRGMGGHFQLAAEINGATIPMIFDTGASAVVLTSADARAAGIDVDKLKYTVSVSTANGTGKAASLLLDQIKIGNIVRKRVRTFIAEDGALETSLLGMTFLETLGRYAVSGNALELVD
jgi:aspartyl protease family protein